MAKNMYVLENLTLTELPSVWIKKFNLPSTQRFTVYITCEHVSIPTPRIKKVSLHKERIALMREMEKQLGGTEYEDSEDWITTIKETRTVSKRCPWQKPSRFGKP